MNVADFLKAIVMGVGEKSMSDAFGGPDWRQKRARMEMENALTQSKVRDTTSSYNALVEAAQQAYPDASPEEAVRRYNADELEFKRRQERQNFDLNEEVKRAQMRLLGARAGTIEKPPSNYTYRPDAQGNIVGINTRNPLDVLDTGRDAPPRGATKVKRPTSPAETEFWKQYYRERGDVTGIPSDAKGDVAQGLGAAGVVEPPKVRQVAADAVQLETAIPELRQALEAWINASGATEGLIALQNLRAATTVAGTAYAKALGEQRLSDQDRVVYGQAVQPFNGVLGLTALTTNKEVAAAALAGLQRAEARLRQTVGRRQDILRGTAAPGAPAPTTAGRLYEDYLK